VSLIRVGDASIKSTDRILTAGNLAHSGDLIPGAVGVDLIHLHHLDHPKGM
jgi:hypothetical protein